MKLFTPNIRLFMPKLMLWRINRFRRFLGLGKL